MKQNWLNLSTLWQKLRQPYGFRNLRTLDVGNNDGYLKYIRLSRLKTALFGFGTSIFLLDVWVKSNANSSPLEFKIQRWLSKVQKNTIPFQFMDSFTTQFIKCANQVTPVVSAAQIAKIDGDSLPPSRRFNFIADTVDKTSNAVVNIQAKRMLLGSNGSGFIVSEDGLIVTNAHVVRNKLIQVLVKLPDGRSFNGIVKALDQEKDLAVIQLDGVRDKLPTMALGSSDSVRTGEWVIAMGSPFKLKNTNTVGVISMVPRISEDLKKAGYINFSPEEVKEILCFSNILYYVALSISVDYIVTDAAINRGNSGGPLVNLDGEAIGINCLGLRRVEGISFAIPIDTVKEFLRSYGLIIWNQDADSWNFLCTNIWNQDAETQCLDAAVAADVADVAGCGVAADVAADVAAADADIPSNYIGITMLTLTPAMLAELKSSQPGFPNIRGGIFVQRVMDGSPPEKAGLMAGDIILGINGAEVRAMTEVYDAVNKDSKLNLTILRNQRIEYITIYPEVIDIH